MNSSFKIRSNLYKLSYLHFLIKTKPTLFKSFFKWYMKETFCYFHFLSLGISFQVFFKEKEINFVIHWIKLSKINHEGLFYLNFSPGPIFLVKKWISRFQVNLEPYFTRFYQVFFVISIFLFSLLAADVHCTWYIVRMGLQCVEKKKNTWANEGREKGSSTLDFFLSPWSHISILQYLIFSSYIICDLEDSS